jgi:polysaccharide biosynthesis protein PslG
VAISLRRLCRALIITALLVPVSAWAGTATAEAAQVGVTPDLTWGATRPEVDRTVALLHDTGVRWVRLNVSWAALEEHGKGAYNAGMLADVDYAVDAATGAGLKVLMPLLEVPYWASSDPQKTAAGGSRSWNRYWKPSRMADYADAFEYLVRRYSARGVHHYQVWNEPNHPRFWPSGIDAGAYVQMLRAAAPAIRAADPTAKVVLGAPSANDYPFLERAYAAGARGLFDIAAVHPYVGSVDPRLCWNQAGTTRRAIHAFCGIEEIHAVMEAAGDGELPLWLTEFGWSTNSGAYGVTEAQQAEYLKAAYAKLAEWRYVEVAFWYTFRNVFFRGEDPADWEANTGVVRVDFSPKPAYAALRDVAMARPSPAPAPPATGPAPADARPHVALTSPGSGSTIEGRIRLLATASDDQGVARVEFLLDGRVVGSDTTAPYQLDASVPATLASGPHTVAARAIDTAGQSATAGATVRRPASATIVRLARGGSGQVTVQGRVRQATRGVVRLVVLDGRAGAGRRAVATSAVRLDHTGRFHTRLRLHRSARLRVEARYSGSPEAAPSVGRSRFARAR